MKKLSLLTFLIIVFCGEAFAQVGFGRTYKAPEPDLTVSYSNPKEYEIADIAVAGAEFLDHNALISLSGLKVGDNITIPGDAISSAIKKLWAQGIIGDVSIYANKVEEGKVYLTIELTERPRLTRFTIEGVNRTQESELTDQIKLIKGRVVTDALIKNTELTIKEHFIDKGYLNAEVDITQESDTLLSNSIVLRIDVDKNSKVKINKISFLGNEEFSDKKLEKQMKSTNEHVRITIFKDIVNELLHINKEEVKEFFDSSRTVAGSDIKQYINDHVKLNFFNSSKFIRSDYEADKEAVITFLNSKGYRDAEIVKDTVYKHDENSINIDIAIDEGQRYYFRNIYWTGNYVHDDQVLKTILGVEKGDVYDMELINKRLNYNPTGRDISSLYMDNGYLFFNVQPVEVAVAGDSIDVEMRIYEGAQATINKIIITGNDRTNDHVILREVRTLPGQKFSRADLIRTQRELSQLGYFDPEQIGINPIPNPADGTVDIEYSLVEKPSDQIELSGGWGGYYGFIGTLGLVFNNFSIRNIPHFEKWRPLPVGDGQRLALRVQANGKLFQNYSLTFSEPWLGGKKPNSFTVSLSHSLQRDDERFAFTNPETGERIAPGVLKLYSMSVSLGRRVKWPDDFFTVSNSLSYLVYDLENYRGRFSFGFEDGTGVAQNFSFNTTIARNSIDSPLFPRSGSSISLSTSLTPPYSAFREKSELNSEEAYEYVEYHKWMFDASYFTSVAGNLVLNARAHFGFLGSYNNDVMIGPFERFVLGGSGLAGTNFIIGNEIIGLRGYEDNSIQPQEFRNGQRIDGGIAYNKFVMELRYPVSLNPSATIYVLGFAEAGNTFNDYQNYNVSNLYKSAGIGARIFMPAFGLIGVDWGYGFDRLPGSTERSGAQFHFTIGQQFR